MLAHDVIEWLYYEQWTDKKKYFFVKMIKIYSLETNRTQLKSTAFVKHMRIRFSV